MLIFYYKMYISIFLYTASSKNLGSQVTNYFWNKTKMKNNWKLKNAMKVCRILNIKRKSIFLYLDISYYNLDDSAQQSSWNALESSKILLRSRRAFPRLESFTTVESNFHISRFLLHPQMSPQCYLWRSFGAVVGWGGEKVTIKGLQDFHRIQTYMMKYWLCDGLWFLHCASKLYYSFCILGVSIMEFLSWKYTHKFLWVFTSGFQNGFRNQRYLLKLK